MITITKICRKCGIEQPIDSFHKRKPRKRQLFLDGHDAYCRSCLSATRKPLDRQRYNLPENRWRELVKSARKRARKRGWQFDITDELVASLFLLQNQRCAATDIPFQFQSRAGCVRNPFAPSIDRIDSTQGYVPSNVRLVLWAVNCAAADYGLDVFIPVAKAIVARYMESNK